MANAPATTPSDAVPVGDPSGGHSGTAPGANPGRSAAPLWSVLGFTFVASLGTGAVTNGIYFLTTSGFGFDRRRNALLGVVLGSCYITGALAAGPLLRRLRARGVSARAVLATIMGLIAALLCVPLIGKLLAGTPPAWTVWVLIVSFAILTGVLWPVIESFLSGGRTQRGLRSAIARFNLVWATAVVGSFWLMAPFWATRPIELLASMGVVHLMACGFLKRMGANPAAHPTEHARAVPPGYRTLLVSSRALLVGTYLYMSTLGPLLPMILSRLGTAETWQTPLGSAWQIGRVALFWGLGVWQGWHGRAWPLWLAGLAVIVGFTGIAVSPNLQGVFGAPWGTVGLLGALFLFGIGLAVVYKSALYYALEVGGAEVDAGGSHEALIGLGYTLGPACLWAVDAAVRSEAVAESGFGVALSGTVTVLFAMVFGLVLLWSNRKRSHVQAAAQQDRR